MTQREQPESSLAMTGPLEGVPLPDLDGLPDYEEGFWQGARSRELRLQQCSDCLVFRHLPTPMCPHCHSITYSWRPVSGRGSVYSFVVVQYPVHPAIRDGGQVPYNISLIELEEQEGLRICSNVLNIEPENIYIGMPVRVRFMAPAGQEDVVLPLFEPT